MVVGGRPVPSGMRQTVCSASQRRRKEGCYAALDEIRQPPTSQEAEELSCAPA